MCFIDCEGQIYEEVGSVGGRGGHRTVPNATLGGWGDCT